MLVVAGMINVRWLALCASWIDWSVLRVSCSPSRRRREGGHERIWLLTFMQHDPGFLNGETCRLEPAEDPFQAKALPMSPV